MSIPSKGASTDRIIGDLDTPVPFASVPIVEHVTQANVFPLQNNSGKPDVFDFFGGKTPDPRWGGHTLVSTLPNYGNAETDLLLVGMGVRFHLDPVTFVAHGTCDGYPAVADWSAPWRAVWEILNGYRIQFTYQQRYMLCDTKLADVAHVSHGEQLDGSGSVTIQPYVERLNELLESRKLDAFMPNATTAPLTAIKDRYLKSQECREFGPFVIERGIPLNIQLVRTPDGTDWTQHGVIKKTMIDMHRHYVIPAGGFAMSLQLKGFELQGTHIAAAREKYKTTCPWLQALPLQRGR